LYEVIWVKNDKIKFEDRPPSPNIEELKEEEIIAEKKYFRPMGSSSFAD
jgi:hypothetical protein